MAEEKRVKLSKSQLAYGLGVTARMLTNYQQDMTNPLPYEFQNGAKGGNLYDLKAAFDWYRKRLMIELEVDDDGNVYNLDAERARLTHHQANKTELESKLLSGEVIYTRDAIAAITRIIAESSAAWMATPYEFSQIAISGNSPTEIEQKCADVVVRTMQELESHGEKYTAQLAASCSVEGVETTSEAVG